MSSSADRRASKIEHEANGEVFVHGEWWCRAVMEDWIQLQGMTVRDTWTQAEVARVFAQLWRKRVTRDIFGESDVP